jgi:hypothetical protein
LREPAEHGGEFAMKNSQIMAQRGRKSKCGRHLPPASEKRGSVNTAEKRESISTLEAFFGCLANLCNVQVMRNAVAVSNGSSRDNSSARSTKF